ncbi:MAG TPA: hypothetical protein VL137_14040 [Polyangiaceae bacterium]|nr:hypothetical protein [Polyangiaceae bacterium]
MTFRLSAAALLLVLSFLCACSAGGTSAGGGGVAGQSSMAGGQPGTSGGSHTGAGGSTGSPNAGAGGAVASGGAMASGGAGTGGAPMVCCLALPVCSPGETQFDNQVDCPANSQCHAVSICCSTIWCAGASSSDAGTCNRDAEYNRHYVATSVSECTTVRYACEANTTAFQNACGCGCEQPTSCPQAVDCMPGPGPSDPLCTDRTMCPFSIRAL